jgi:hypothetical protein
MTEKKRLLELAGITEAKEEKFFVGEWGGDWDSKMTKKNTWYVLEEGNGGPMDRSDIIGFVYVKSVMTEQQLRDKLVTQYGSGIAKHAYIQFRACTAGQRNKWIKEQEKEIQSIKDVIAKSGLKV